MKKFMVIERFKDGCLDATYDRFRNEGRLLPDGLVYVNSWLNRQHHRWFQLMETDDPGLFDIWFKCWRDLVEFKVFEIDCKSTLVSASVPRYWSFEFLECDRL